MKIFDMDVLQIQKLSEEAGVFSATDQRQLLMAMQTFVDLYRREVYKKYMENLTRNDAPPRDFVNSWVIQEVDPFPSRYPEKEVELKPITVEDIQKKVDEYLKDVDKSKFINPIFKVKMNELIQDTEPPVKTGTESVDCVSSHYSELVFPKIEEKTDTDPEPPKTPIAAAMGLPEIFANGTEAMGMTEYGDNRNDAKSNDFSISLTSPYGEKTQEELPTGFKSLNSMLKGGIKASDCCILGGQSIQIKAPDEMAYSLTMSRICLEDLSPEPDINEHTLPIFFINDFSELSLNQQESTLMLISSMGGIAVNITNTSAEDPTSMLPLRSRVTSAIDKIVAKCISHKSFDYVKAIYLNMPSTVRAVKWAILDYPEAVSFEFDGTKLTEEDVARMEKIAQHI